MDIPEEIELEINQSQQTNIGDRLTERVFMRKNTFPGYSSQPEELTDCAIYGADH